MSEFVEGSVLSPMTAGKEEVVASSSKGPQWEGKVLTSILIQVTKSTLCTRTCDGAAPWESCSAPLQEERKKSFSCSLTKPHHMLHFLSLF